MESFEQPETVKEPYEQIEELARKFLVDNFPETDERTIDRLLGSFVLDVLTKAGMERAQFFHRMDPEEQQNELQRAGIDISSLFSDVSNDIFEYYKQKFGSGSKPKDILEISE